jgi:hypothetical protein
MKLEMRRLNRETLRASENSRPKEKKVIAGAGIPLGQRRQLLAPTGAVRQSEEFGRERILMACYCASPS